jgi:hypothetical protein
MVGLDMRVAVQAWKSATVWRRGRGQSGILPYGGGGGVLGIAGRGKALKRLLRTQGGVEVHYLVAGRLRAKRTRPRCPLGLIPGHLAGSASPMATPRVIPTPTPRAMLSNATPTPAPMASPIAIRRARGLAFPFPGGLSSASVLACTSILRLWRARGPANWEPLRHQPCQSIAPTNDLLLPISANTLMVLIEGRTSEKACRALGRPAAGGTPLGQSSGFESLPGRCTARVPGGTDEMGTEAVQDPGSS